MPMPEPIVNAQIQAIHDSTDAELIESWRYERSYMTPRILNALVTELDERGISTDD